MSDTYKTITAPAEAIVTEKRSKFLAFAYPAEDTDEIKERIGELTRRYHDARHICWAYMLGAAREDFRSNDNGEPSGTAGKPILGQINSMELTNILVVVVRYFGGIKLGTPGLIAAYRLAAREALDAATTVERHEMVTIEFSYPYMAMNDIMKLVRADGVEMVSSTYDNTCFMTLNVERERNESLRLHLKEAGASIMDHE